MVNSGIGIAYLKNGIRIQKFEIGIGGFYNNNKNPQMNLSFN